MVNDNTETDLPQALRDVAFSIGVCGALTVSLLFEWLELARWPLLPVALGFRPGGSR